MPPFVQQPDFKDNRPLTCIEDGRRGRSFVLDPSCSGRQQLIFDFDSVCVRGELLGLVLSIMPTKTALGSCPPIDPTLTSERLIMVRAHLQWGIGGASFSAMCDFVQGVQIGLIAEALRVSAEYVVFGRVDAEGNDIEEPCCLPSFNVGAGAGYGARSHNSNVARFTDYVDIPLVDGKVCVPIPPFAVSFSVLPIADGSCSADVVGFCGGTPVRYDIITPLSNLGQHNVENALPIYNGARAVVITNRNIEPAPLRAFVIFGLAL